MNSSLRWLKPPVYCLQLKIAKKERYWKVSYREVTKKSMIDKSKVCYTDLTQNLC